MALDATLNQFAEFVGSEVKRVENMIPTGGNTGGQFANSLIITGKGRPDNSGTTEGKIRGNEPNGTIYVSIDGAGVGAYEWQKQNNKWQVTSADTGVRIIRNGAVNIKSGYITLRRVNNTVECAFTGGQWGAIYFYGSADPNFRRKSHPKRMDILGNNKIPFGFRATNSIMLPFYGDDGDHLGMVYVGGLSNYNYIELRFKDKPPTADMDIVRMPVISWITDDPYPSTLPT